MPKVVGNMNFFKDWRSKVFFEERDGADFFLSSTEYGTEHDNIC